MQELDARADHYAPASRDALHHLERALFEEDPPAPAEPAGAVRLLQGGGERAEAELVAAHVARLLREDGFAPEEVAIVVRSVSAAAPLLEQVLGAYGIPYALTRPLRAGQTALGRGLVGLLRAARPGGTADDLLAYLRTPRVVRVAALVDRLEADVRRQGLRDATAARALFEDRHFALGALDRVAGAAERGAGPLCRTLAREARVLLAAPHRRSAAVLADEEAVDAGWPPS